MTDNGFDLNAYLSRIGYTGPREPSLAVLRAIVAAHAATIPFENIDVLLRRGIRIDLESVQRKLVAQRRGGYCFEQNTLLETGLAALGFTLSLLIARVVRGLPAGAIGPRSHKLLRVDLPEGAYIADVGFGNLTPTAPIALRPNDAQETPNEPFRLLPLDREFVLQAGLGNVWDSVYRFTLDPAFPIDFEAANWVTSTYPMSPFVRNLIVARPGAGSRSTLFNRRFTIRAGDNRATHRVLSGIEQYREVLVEHFGLSLDKAELAEIAAVMDVRAPDEAVYPSFS
jgi:N-hydroxyarylamine O-acetyltransferase